MDAHSRGGTVKLQGGHGEILDRVVATPTSSTSPQPGDRGKGLGEFFDRVTTILGQE